MTVQKDTGAALGHLRLGVSNLADAVSFFESLGAKQDVDRENFAVVEFGDRTRLQLTKSDQASAEAPALQFDFVVEDIDTTWSDLKAKGLTPSDIARSRVHDNFTVAGPDGYEVKINSRFKGG